MNQTLIELRPPGGRCGQLIGALAADEAPKLNIGRVALVFLATRPGGPPIFLFRATQIISHLILPARLPRPTTASH